MKKPHIIKNMLIGAGTVLSVFPTAPTAIPKFCRPAESDIASLRSDWEKIGGDLSYALEHEKHVEAPSTQED